MATDTQEDLRVEAEEHGSRPKDAAAKHASATQIFHYSGYVHVGPGAEECEEGEAGSCSDPLHFHAWCRMPNKVQHRDIVEKALAAKARRIRAMRDPEADAHAVLEAALGSFDAGQIDTVIDEIVEVEWRKDYAAALADASEEEQFERIDADRERFQELLTAGEGDKPEADQTDEFRELARHVETFVTWLRDRARERSQPRRAALRDLGFEKVVDILRQQRIERSGEYEFDRVQTAWVWFVGTLHPEKHATTGRPHKRVWSAMGNPDDPDPGTMHDAAPEVIEAVEEMFNSFNEATARATPGNS